MNAKPPEPTRRNSKDGNPPESASVSTDISSVENIPSGTPSPKYSGPADGDKHKCLPEKNKQYITQCIFQQSWERVSEWLLIMKMACSVNIDKDLTSARTKHARNEPVT